MKKLLVLALSFIVFQSCVTLHNGNIVAGSVPCDDDFQIVKTISGEEKAVYILGFGGISNDGLVKEAKKNMYDGWKLVRNEVITNITVDNKKTFFLGGIVIEHTVIISADVVRCGTKQLINNKSLKLGSNNNNQSPKYDANRNYPDIKKVNELKTGYTDYNHISNIKKGTYVLYKNNGFLNRAIIKWKSGVTDGYFVWKVERFNVLKNNWQKLDIKGDDISKKSIIAYKSGVVNVNDW